MYDQTLKSHFLHVVYTGETMVSLFYFEMNIQIPKIVFEYFRIHLNSQIFT